MDSPSTRTLLDSPFLRAQEAKYGHSSSFSLGPAMHEPGGFDTSSGTDSNSQSTADLTAFVQNLLHQMQLRFQSMSDAILIRIDEMAARIEDMERAVDEVLREVAGDDELVLPSPSSSPIRRANVAPPSPDIRKYSLGPSGSLNAVSPLIGRYSSASKASPAMAPLKSPRQSTLSSYNVPGSPDFRRHSLPSSFGSNSPDLRGRSIPTVTSFVPSSPGTRTRSDPYLK